MAGINANLLLGIGQGVTQPAGPTQTMQNALQLGAQQNALQSGRLNNERNQLQLAADQALGRDYQASIDPNTGRFDNAAFQRRVAADRDASIYAGRDIANSQQMRGAQISNDMSARQLAEAKMHAAIGAISTVAANPNATPADAVRTLYALDHLGVTDDNSARTVLSSVLSHPHGVQAGAASLLQQIQAPQEMLAQVYGTPGTVNNGGHVLAGRFLPASQGGGFVPNTDTPMGLPPTFLAQQITVTGPNGQPMQTTIGDMLQQEGHSQQAGQTQPAAGQQQYPWAATGGAYPQAQGQPQPQPTQAQPQPTMGHAVPVGPDPGTAQAQQMQAQAGAEMANDAVRAAQGSPERKAILSNMLDDLQQFTSGNGLSSKARQAISAINNTFGWNIDSDGINAAQSFDKYATQVAQAQAQALGAGTDAKLLSASASNPNSHLNNAVNVQMAHAMLGNEDAITAKARAWLESGYHPSQYQQWSTQFNRNFDPQAFQIRRMTQDEKNNVTEQMRKAGTLKEFQAKYNRMAAQGLFDDGGQ